MSVAVSSAISASGLLEEGRIVAAVSGGPDSTALLVGLVEAGADVIGAHFDHRLRPGSDRDAEHVRALCSRVGVPLIAGSRSGALERGSVQAAARRHRYRFLEAARMEAGAALIATGHHAGDVAEGVLLHLLRGTGVRGLRGVPARTGRVVRPLLTVTREEIEEFLRARGLRPIRDPSNSDARFARARVRHHLLPALELARPGITARLGRVAAQAARQHAAAGDDRPALRSSFVAAGGNERRLSRRHLRAMDALLTAREGGDLDLPGGITFRAGSGDHVFEGREPAPSAGPRLLVAECAGCGTPGSVHVSPGRAVALGGRRPGLRIRLAGGTRKVQDVLVDARIPRWRRDAVPVVFVDGVAAWIPGIAADPALALPSSEPGLHVEVRFDPDNEGSQKGPVLVSTHPSRSFSY